MSRPGVIRCLLAAALFGASAPAASVLAQEMPTLTLAGLLYLGAALAVAPAVDRRPPPVAAVRAGWRLVGAGTGRAAERWGVADRRGLRLLGVRQRGHRPHRSATVPFIGTAGAWVALADPVTATQVVAASLAAVGVALTLHSAHEHRHRHQPTVHDHEHRHPDERHTHKHPRRFVGHHSHRHTHHDVLEHTHPHLPDLHRRHTHDHDHDEE